MLTTLTRFGVMLTVVIVLAYAPLPLAVKALCISLVLHGWLCGGTI